LKESGSDYIKFNLAIQYILSNQAEEGYKILNDLYNKGFKLGRTGIYLYLNENKKDKNIRSSEILDRTIAELYDTNEILTASMVIKQKLIDKMYSFKSNEEFEAFFSELFKNKFDPTYKIYFSAIALQFYSRSNQNKVKMQEIINNLENEISELPYLFYRYAFEEFIYLKDFEKAEDILTKMNRYTYSQPKNNSDNADYYTAKGEYIKARNILLEGIKEFPESTLELQLASLYLTQSDFPKAEMIYENILKELPESDYLYKWITNEYAKTGNLDKAIAFYSEAVGKFPDDPELLNNYAYLLAQNSKNLEKALQYVEKALESTPDAITFLDTKAWIFFKMGRNSEAETIMEGIFADESAFYYSSSAELYDHFKEIKTALNKSEDLNTISLNKTAVMLSEIFSKSNFILQTGF